MSRALDQHTDKYHEAAVAEGIRRMFHALQGVQPFMPLLPLVVVLGMWGWVDHRLLGVWLLAAVSVPVLRFALVHAYFADASPEGASARRWAQRIAWTALWDGVVWGAAGVLFFLPDSVPHQVLMVTMVVGIPAGSVFVTSYWPQVQYAFAIPAVGLMALKLMSVGSPAWLGLGIGMWVYLVILYQIMRRAHRAALDAILLRFENLDLIEQLREQKEAAEQANIAKSKFLAAASHDLRQPLHALTLFTTALQERGSRSTDQGIVESIRRCVSALDDLFQSLLDISRLDAGIVEASPAHFKLRPLIERLAHEYAPQASARKVRLDWECADLVAYSDPALVERIMLNLLSNAIRYTDNGRIKIDVTPVRDSIAIGVTDTGVGIPYDKQEEVFHEFVQLQNPERDRTKGLGLGLAIVRRLANLLGCRVELRSRPGEGSRFIFEIPVGDEQALAQSPSQSRFALTNHLAGKTIIVIEDEAEVREGTRVLLEGWGCSVIAAEELTGALAQLEETGDYPDIVIADYRLREGVTGAEVIERLQAIYGASLPGLIITGDTAPERLQEAQASGYQLMHKPVQPAKLRTLLNKLLTGPLQPDPVAS